MVKYLGSRDSESSPGILKVSGSMRGSRIIGMWGRGLLRRVPGRSPKRFFLPSFFLSFTISLSLTLLFLFLDHLVEASSKC